MLCGFCDREFTPKRSTRKYCSARCRCAAWQRRRVALPVAEAKAIREQLTVVLNTVWEAKATLEKYGAR